MIKTSPDRRKRTVYVLFFLVLLGYPCHSQSSKDQKLFLVCGDSKVLLVDFERSRDSIPAIVWTWDAHLAQDRFDLCLGLPAGLKGALVT